MNTLYETRTSDNLDPLLGRTYRGITVITTKNFWQRNHRQMLPETEKNQSINARNTASS